MFCNKILLIEGLVFAFFSASNALLCKYANYEEGKAGCCKVLITNGLRETKLTFRRDLCTNSVKRSLFLV